MVGAQLRELFGLPLPTSPLMRQCDEAFEGIESLFATVRTRDGAELLVDDEVLVAAVRVAVRNDVDWRRLLESIRDRHDLVFRHADRSASGH